MNERADIREYESEVPDQYDIEAKNTRKMRGSVFCDTNKGTMLLKETKVSDSRTLFYDCSDGEKTTIFGEYIYF